MRAAKRREEVVQSHFVGQVGDLKKSGYAFVLLGVKQVVRADAKIEDMSRAAP